MFGRKIRAHGCASSAFAHCVVRGEDGEVGSEILCFYWTKRTDVANPRSAAPLHSKLRQSPTSTARWV